MEIPPPVGGPSPIQPSESGTDPKKELHGAIKSFTQLFREPRPNASDMAPKIIALANCAKAAIQQRGN